MAALDHRVHAVLADPAEAGEGEAGFGCDRVDQKRIVPFTKLSGRCETSSSYYGYGYGGYYGENPVADTGTGSRKQRKAAAKAAKKAGA